MLTIMNFVRLKFLMFIWVFLFQTILGMGIVPHVFAADAVQTGLIIWVGDGKKSDRKNYDSALRALNEVAPHLHFQTLCVSSQLTEAVVAELPKLFKQGEKISTIILATHGRTDKRKKQTILESMGGFGPYGSFGELRNIFKTLGEAKLLSEKVHLFLNACSTFCDSEESVKLRSEALYKGLTQYNVKELTIWGARQPILFDDYRKDSYRQAMAKVQQKKVRVLPVLGFISYYLISHGFNAESRQVATSAVKTVLQSSGASWATAIIGTLSFFITGTKGFLIRVTPVETTVEQVELHTGVAKVGICSHL